MQNVPNITFNFGTSPNAKPEEKKWGDMAYYIPPPEKVGGTHPLCPPPNCTHACKMDNNKKYALVFAQPNKSWYKYSSIYGVRRTSRCDALEQFQQMLIYSFYIRKLRHAIFILDGL